MEVGITNPAGHRVIDIGLQRHRLGVKVTVKVDPEVEEFFKRWGGGATEEPRHGRLWRPMKDGERLSLWSFETGLNADDYSYSLFHTGSGLNVDGDSRINLSFIRLVNAVSGTSFIIDSVISRSELERVANKLRRAAEHFYTEYIQTVHLSVFVGVRDMQREGYQGGES